MLLWKKVGIFPFYKDLFTDIALWNASIVERSGDNDATLNGSNKADASITVQGSVDHITVEYQLTGYTQYLETINIWVGILWDAIIVLLFIKENFNGREVFWASDSSEIREPERLTQKLIFRRTVLPFYQDGGHYVVPDR